MYVQQPSQTVTQRIEFECSYVFSRMLNSHRYKMEVTVSGPQRFVDNGITIEFAELRKLMQSVVPDSRFVYCSFDPVGSDVGRLLENHGILTQSYGCVISAENLCNVFATMIQHELDQEYPGVVCLSIKLRETSDSYVTWTKGSVVAK